MKCRFFVTIIYSLLLWNITATKQQHRFEKATTQITKQYAMGDTVGKISDIDRTNTDGHILPCKVKEVKMNRERGTIYKLYAPSGIIRTCFSDEDLVDLWNVTFPALENTEPDSLDEISTATATRQIGVSIASSHSTICSCKGSCINQKCRCKRTCLRCATKCHPWSTFCKNRLLK